MKKILIISSAVSVLAAVFLIFTGYGLVRDINALIDRAQVAADREDMVQYLSELKENLEQRGMTHGHFALIFKTPANDLTLHFKTINRILERLQSIKDIPKNETAYQVALNDIRGTIRELENPALGYLWTEYWFLAVGGVGIWLWPLIVAIRNGDF
ncbi:MAG: hypothetical protein NTW46_00675 [Candidatus Nealsonbacteria bacterium]|nr:hypothetical protein [Candidatus Nealsonbacteria bacterium]